MYLASNFGRNDKPTKLGNSKVHYNLGITQKNKNKKIVQNFSTAKRFGAAQENRFLDCLIEITTRSPTLSDHRAET